MQLEAMPCECALEASDTAPVREVIRNNENGVLFVFFNTDQLVSRIEKILDAVALCR